MASTRDDNKAGAETPFVARRVPWRISTYAAIGIGLVLTVAVAIIFQDNLVRFLINPRTPFQTSLPPSAPEYGARGAWVLWPSASSDKAKADIFYVHSTTYYSNERWNAPIADAESDGVLRRIASPNEAGPFFSIGDVYGPRYRQATRYAFFTHKYDGVAARMLAYKDVSRAFQYYLESADEQRPLVLVGYGQGGLHALGLLREHFQGADNPLRKRLAAAYIIGYGTPQDFLNSVAPDTPVCLNANDIRCTVSYVDFEPQFDEEMRRARQRTMMWTVDGKLAANEDSSLACTNPLSWSPTTDYVNADHHIGAGSATGLKLGAKPPAVSRAVGAQCIDGVLAIDRPAQEYLRRGNWFGAKWRAQPFNIFYHDIAKNVADRVSAARVQMEEEYRLLAPISETVDLEGSPVNKVPPVQD